MWTCRTRQRRGASAMAGLAAVLTALALWPATVEADQHERTAEPRGPLPLALACPEQDVPDAGFADVAPGSVHARAVSCAAWYGIAQGGPGARPANAFGPALMVRRDQMASFIARLVDYVDAQIDEELLAQWDGRNRFDDVAAGTPHVAAINRLAEAGIVAGGPGGRPATEYGPALNVRRDQMASFLNRSLAVLLPEPLTTDQVYFDDLAGVLPAHAANINALAQEGVVVGRHVDGHWFYEPDERVRRDQMTSFLMRTLDLLVDLGVVAPREPAAARTEQSYTQAPQEIVTAEPGHTFDIDVFGFDQAEANPAPVDVALFPCDVLDTADPTDFTFRDADGDGHADGLGTSDTGAAVITSLHGDATDTTHLDSVQPDDVDRISYSLHSAAADCTTPVVFHDANTNDQLDVNAQGQPLEHWNYTERAWEIAEADDVAVAVTANGRVIILDATTG